MYKHTPVQYAHKHIDRCNLYHVYPQLSMYATFAFTDGRSSPGGISLCLCSAHSLGIGECDLVARHGLPEIPLFPSKGGLMPAISCGQCMT